MGKTFVALAVAYSILRAQRKAEYALKGLLQEDPRLTPPNDALYRKWDVRRRVRQALHLRPRWAHGSRLAAAIESTIWWPRTQRAAGVIMKTNRLDSSSSATEAPRNTSCSPALPVWSNRFPKDSRSLLLKGAPEGWPRDERQLGVLWDEEREQLHFDEDEIHRVLRRIESGQAEGDQQLMEEALTRARDLGTPYRRDRAEDFRTFRTTLSRVYRRACWTFSTSFRSSSWRGAQLEERPYGRSQRVLRLS
jgi:hypothetical protein